MKKDFADGICNTCGNTGLAGEKCLVCGDMISNVSEGLVDPITHNDELSVDDFGATKEPDVYPLDVLEKEEKEEDEVI